MKQYIIFLILIVSTYSIAEETYKDLWKEYNRFYQQSKPKSALKIANKIYQKGKKENNAVQTYRSILKKGIYFRNEEDTYLKKYKLYCEEIKKSEPPLRSLLEYEAGLALDDLWNKNESNTGMKKITTYFQKTLISIFQLIVQN